MNKESEYLENLKYYLNNHGDSEKEFLENEIKRFKNEKEKIKSRLPKKKNNESLLDIYKSLPNAERLTKLKNLIFEYSVRLDRFTETKEIFTEIDLSDSKGTEKIIMLVKLGVIKYLKEKEPFDTSTNALASVISGFTGMGVSTVQSYINPINNPDVDQKNNPLLSEKTVNKVNQKFISIGFNPSK